MATATAEVTMNAAPDTVWAIVRDFHGLHHWMPGIESLVSEGDDRVLSMMGMSIRERLVDVDDDTMAITYSIIEGAPVESHEATITVHAADGGSRVTWEVTATPDEMVAMMQGLYQSSLEPLKTKVEG